nr:spore coat protein U domain-containing protein [uncultured Pseudomonas sp.]
MTINVSGTLTRPPCTLTSARTLTANFGSIEYDKVAAAPAIDLPLLLTCPPNSSFTIAITASSALSDTLASAGRANLGYQLTRKDNSSAVNIRGIARTVSNANGVVDLGMTAKLVANGVLSEGAFSASAVVNITYL